MAHEKDIDDAITIREISPDEAGLIGPIIRESFRGQAALLGFTREEYPHFVEFMPDEAVRADLENGNHASLLFNKGEPVGTLWYRPEPDDTAVGILRKLAVLPASRGRGYGERLFAHTEERLRDVGIRQARLYCNAQFARLHAYYERLGYEMTKRDRFSTLPFDVLTMEKDLTRR